VRVACGDIDGARAARADAIRLCERKGATVPAERLSATEESVAATAQPQTEPLAAAGTSAWVPDTLATRDLSRNYGLLLTDPEQAIEYIAPDHVRIDRRRVVAAQISQGRDDVVDSMRAMLSLGVTDVRHEVIAVRGERLGLIRLSFDVGDAPDWPI